MYNKQLDSLWDELHKDESFIDVDYLVGNTVDSIMLTVTNPTLVRLYNEARQNKEEPSHIEELLYMFSEMISMMEDGHEGR